MIVTLLLPELFRFSQSDAQQLVLEHSELHFTSEDDCTILSVLGSIRNTGTRALESPHFEIQFFDAAGKLIDSFTTVSYGLIALPEDSATFRARQCADKPEELYDHHTIQIKKARVSKSWF